MFNVNDERNNQLLDNDTQQEKATRIINNIEQVLNCDLSHISINNIYDVNVFLNNPSQFIEDRQLSEKILIIKELIQGIGE